jgi:hypothetical protein
VSGATATNEELETYSNDLRNLSKELEAGTRATNQAGRRIAKIAKECVASADELFSILQKVRTAGNVNFGSAMKTTFRTMRERKTIEKLQNVLKERRTLLDSACTL